MLTSSIATPRVLGTGDFKIKIIGSLPVFKEVDCYVNYKKSLSKITNEYAKFIGVARNFLKFTFNSKELKDDSTPRNFKMESGDVIQVERRPLIHIKFINPLDIFEEKDYRIAGNKSIFNLTKEHSNLIGAANNCVKYTLKGKEVQYGDTPDRLGMKSGDVIQVERIQCISIKITYSLDIFKEADYVITRNQSLFHIINEYTQLIGEDLNFVKFTLNGQEVNQHDTPESLGMKDGDVIQVERLPSINIKFVCKSYEEVSVRVSLNTVMSDFQKHYKRVAGIEGKLAMVYNGRILKDDETPLSLHLKEDDAIQVYTKDDTINLKMISTSDGSDVSLQLPLIKSIDHVRNQYKRSVSVTQKTIWIHNGRVLPTYGDTSLSLNIKDDDIIHVYTEDDTINVKVSLQIDIPNGIDFSLKYGDSLDDIMKEYTDQNGIDMNSVRFMYDGKRIKSGSKPEKLGIPPNAVIHVFKEYDTISLMAIDDNDYSKKFYIQANYGDSFAKIIEDSGRFGEDPYSIEFHTWNNRSLLLDEQTPKELEMDNNDSIIFHKTRVINIKFTIRNVFIVDSNDMNTITEVRIKHEHPLDNILKKCANSAGVDQESVKFLYGGRRIRTGNTPYALSMDENATVELHNIVEDIKLKFVGSFDFSEKVVLNGKCESNIELAKQEYAAIVGEDVKNLRFMFNGILIWKEETPEFLQEYYGLKENDIIEVYKDQPSEYINLKVVDEDYPEVNIRTTYDVPIGKLKQYYANRVGKLVYKLRFLFDGRRINDEESPRSLEMEEDDVIEVYKEEQLG